MLKMSKMNDGTTAGAAGPYIHSRSPCIAHCLLFLAVVWAWYNDLLHFSAAASLTCGLLFCFSSADVHLLIVKLFLGFGKQRYCSGTRSAPHLYVAILIC